jgi:hypothetical protein
MEPWSSSSYKPVYGWRSGRAAASSTTRGSRWVRPVQRSLRLGTMCRPRWKSMRSCSRRATLAPSSLSQPRRRFGAGTQATFKIRMAICGKWPGIPSGWSTREAPRWCMRTGHQRSSGAPRTREAWPWYLALGGVSMLHRAIPRHPRQQRVGVAGCSVLSAWGGPIFYARSSRSPRTSLASDGARPWPVRRRILPAGPWPRQNLSYRSSAR